MIRLAVVALCGVALGGCAAAGITVAGAGAGAAMSAGVEHSMSGIVYKTFTAPIEEVRAAARESLGRMDFKQTQDAPTQDGQRIVATAINRQVEIDLEKVSANATRMRVTVNNGDSIFFKDSATGTEIIVQTGLAIDHLKARANAPAAVKNSESQPGGKRL